MKVKLSVIALALLLAFPPYAAANAAAEFVIAGSLLSATAGDLSNYTVTLYAGDGNQPQFQNDPASRKKIAETQSDRDGRFLFDTQSLQANDTYTVRAINSNTRLGGQFIGAVSGEFVDGVAIQLSPQTDPNFGLKQSTYASTSFLFVTDRKPDAHSAGGFGNDHDPNWQLRFGTFDAGIALSAFGLASGKCGIAPGWSCSAPASAGNDSYAQNFKVTAAGGAVSNALSTELAIRLGASTVKSVVLFVHGYNTSLEGGGEALARVTYEMSPSAGVPLLYSWPSTAQLLGYVSDRQNAVQSASNNLQSVLNVLAAQPAGVRVEIVAHSMGTYALMLALNQWAQAHPTAQQPFDALTFFAADTDASAWNQDSAAIRRLFHRVKFYVNANDRALQLSKCEMSDLADRVGELRNWTAPVAFFDATGKVAQVGFGHGYFGNSALVASDFNASFNGANAQASAVLRSLSWLYPVTYTPLDTGAPVASGLCFLAGHNIHF